MSDGYLIGEYTVGQKAYWQAGVDEGYRLGRKDALSEGVTKDYYAGASSGRKEENARIVKMLKEMLEVYTVESNRWHLFNMLIKEIEETND
jgi:hypothetical protein